MKQTTFITTFSEKGYYAYGKRWIETFIKNTSDVHAVIFTDFDLVSPDPRIVVLNFDENITDHKSWVAAFNAAYSNNEFEKQFGIRFSYKSFVMMHALTHMSGYIVWLDGDCIFKPNTYSNFAESVLNGNFIAVQVDKVAEKDVWKYEDHVESGIVVFDADHADKEIFVSRFKNSYSIPSITSMPKPYDGFIINRCCRDLKRTDLLPPNYTITANDPELTFIHPELQSRFIHFIGHKESITPWLE